MKNLLCNRLNLARALWSCLTIVLFQTQALAFEYDATLALQEEIEVTGTVSGPDGVLEWATVASLNDPTRYAMTDESGVYTLMVQANDTLVVSYVGHSPRNIAVNGRNNVDVVLSVDDQQLDEVVIVGYGTQEKANLTGAVSTITTDQIENRVVPTAANLLQGLDPSLNITFGTGTPDGSHGINIRGTASINGGSPLIIADGVEVNLSQINPHNIESVTVLKDASASAIYGARASSGVILINTKSGSNTNGKAQITYNGRMSIAQNTTSTDFIRTGYDHVKIANQFYSIYQGRDMALYDEQDMQMLYDRRNDRSEHPDRPWTIVGDDGSYNYYGNFDWYGYLYRRERPQQEHSISVNGGNDKFKYYVSGRAWDEDGIFNIYKDNHQKYSFFTKLDAQLKPWLSYTATINYDASEYKYAGHHQEQRTIHTLQNNVYSSFLPFNPDGSVVGYTNQLVANSPIGQGHVGFLSTDKSRNSRANNYLILSNRFDFDLGDDFVLTAMHAYKKRDRKYEYRNMPYEYSRKEGEFNEYVSGTIYNFYQESHFDVNDHNVNIYGTYDKTFANDHKITVVAGGQYEDYHQVNLIANATDLLSDNLSSFATAGGEYTINQEIGAFRTLGFFGRLNYNFRDKYLFEASARWDGTSRFSPDERWGFFPSASVGWRMSNESFWEPLKYFWNDSKIRFSAGSLGNQQVGYYSYIEEINASNQMAYTFDGSTRANYASISNPITQGLTWETITTYNLGADFAFLRNRLGFTGDYFIRNTSDMLTQTLTLPGVFGAPAPQGNAADMQTKGWEVHLNWKDHLEVAGKPFNYNIGFTLGDYTSEITKYNNPDRLISDQYVGRKLGEIWGYQVKGLFESDEAAAEYQSRINDAAVNNRVYNSKRENYLQAGDVEFIDRNGDGIINAGSGTVDDPGDQVIIGNSQPRYNYGIQLGADWGGFDFSVFLQGVGKRDWMPTQDAYDFWGPYGFPSLSFIHEDFMNNTWSETNPGAYFPRPRGYQSYSSGSLGVPTDRYIQDVSYLRLKNLTIGYTLPNLSSWGIDNMRIYVAGENLHVWSPVKEYSKTVDPELTVTTTTLNNNSGVGYPFSKTYTFGVSITF